MKTAALALAVMMCGGGLCAQLQDGGLDTGQEQTPVRWMLTASAQGSPVGKGAAVTARLHAEIQPGWHIYSLHEEPGGPTAMRISVPAKGWYAIDGDLDAPQPRSENDPAFGMETHFYTGAVEVKIPLRAVRKNAGPVAVDVFYQACNRHTCLRPTVEHLTAAAGKAGEP